MPILEIVAAALGALCVGLLIVRNHWSWPIGLGQVILTAAVFWEAKLYAETGLQVIFAFLQVYGWWAWLASRNTSADHTAGMHGDELIRVRTLPRAGWFLSIAITGLTTLIIAWFLIAFTDGQAPVFDALITASSLTAQYLLAARYHENWAYWIFVDVVSTPLYLARGLYPMAILYVIFLGMAIVGWFRWKRALESQTRQSGGVEWTLD